MPSLTSAAAWPMQGPFYGVVVFSTLYWYGSRRRVSVHRGALSGRARDAAFFGGMLAVLVALDSPVDPLSETSFAAHMTQHVLLLTVAPPLIVLAAPWTQIWHPVPLGLRRSLAKALVRSRPARPLRVLARAVTRPLPAWLIFNVDLLVWHIPRFYDATLHVQALHDLEHLLFFGTALLFWTQIVDSAPFRTRLDWLQRATYVTSALVVSWILAIVLALAPAPLYGAYAELASRPAGLSALGDQQIAAGVMWVPGSLAFTIAFIVFFYRWLDPEAGAGRGRRARLRLAGGTES